MRCFIGELTGQTNQLNMEYEREEKIRGAILWGSVKQWWDALGLGNLIIFCSIHQVGSLTKPAEWYSECLKYRI